MHPLIGRVSKALADNTPMVNNGQSKTTPTLLRIDAKEFTRMQFCANRICCDDQCDR